MSGESTENYQEKKREAYNVRNLAEWLLLEVTRRLVLAFHEADLDELVWYILLAENGGDTASAGRQAHSVEFKNHFGLLMRKR